MEGCACAKADREREDMDLPALEVYGSRAKCSGVHVCPCLWNAIGFLGGTDFLLQCSTQERRFTP